jgi:DNA repair protein RecO (recombination protein O)
MKFADEGIIINIKKYGENSLIVKVFSSSHGIYRGFVKFAKSSKAQSIYQIGNLISFEFVARLEESLGSFACVDLVESFSGKIIFNKLKLTCAKSLFSMLDEFFLERENHQNLFVNCKNFLELIANSTSAKEEIISAYIKLELNILENLGYGLDLTKCAATGNSSNLTFVSPKTGRAVSMQAGLPYQKKLLNLPEFLIENSSAVNQKQLIDGLKLSGFFLEKFLNEEELGLKNFKREQILQQI